MSIPQDRMRHLRKVLQLPAVSAEDIESAYEQLVARRGEGVASLKAFGLWYGLRDKRVQSLPFIANDIGVPVMEIDVYIAYATQMVKEELTKMHT